MSTLALSSPQPSVVHHAHLHLELSFIVLLLLPFLVLVIAACGPMDHAEEAGVTDVEVVACAERIPPILERRAHFVVRAGPLQAYKPRLPRHQQLDGFLLVVAMCGRTTRNNTPSEALIFHQTLSTQKANIGRIPSSTPQW